MKIKFMYNLFPFSLYTLNDRFTLNDLHINRTCFSEGQFYFD
jgi:hypothetical protein